MKQLLLGLVCLFGTSQAFSQEKAHIGVSGGVSIPVFNYASSKINQDDAGLARMGMSYELSGFYKMNQTFGFAALFRHQFNSFNDKEYKKAVLDEVNAPVAIDISVKSKPWRINTLMVGLNGSVPLMDKLSLESKFLIGASTVTSPDIELSLAAGGNSETMKSTGKPTTYGSLLLGTGLKYQYNDRICLLGNVDFWITETEVISTNSSSSSSSSADSKSVYINLPTVNVSVGVGYKL